MASSAQDPDTHVKFLTCGHADHILKSINRLRKEKKLCDITLKVGEKEFCAHRVILSACSDYFCAMFTGNMEESQKSVVELQGLDSDTMEFILDFVYTESIRVSVENVQALLPAACLLQLTGMCRLYTFRLFSLTCTVHNIDEIIVTTGLFKINYY